MPLTSTSDDAPTTFPKPDYLTLSNFKRGVITLIDKSRLPKDALEEATNLFLVEDGQPSLRPGVDWFGTAPLLPVPGAATATAASGSGLGIGAYKYSVTFVNAQGETSAGTEATVTTTSGNQKVNLTAIPLGAGGTISRKIYRTAVGGATGTEKLVTTIANNTATTYSDTTADGSLGASIPTSNTATAPIEGFDYFDSNGAIHLVVAAAGNIFRSTDDGNAWVLCSGATMTSGLNNFMNQYNSYLYLTNGTDNITRYDGSTTLVTYGTLTTPSAATAATTPASPGTGYTYYYKISAVNTVGFSAASTKVTVVHGVPRESWDKTTNFITLTLPAYQSGQTRYDIYWSQDDLNYYYLDSAANPNLAYKDDGSAIVVPSTTAPVDNTTQGPTVAELVNVGSRMYGVRDPAHRYRIWFTSGSPPYGSFSSAYDGGYLDWQPGGKYLPVKVADYRDGKGTPLATIWCDSADGQGCILQMSLDTLTVGDISITVPSAYKLPGSRGTPSPGSVINVLNDYMFYNSQAFYNLGSRAQLLQILSTDEVSANIRPTIKTILHSAEKGIATAYYDAKVYFSVPYDNITNNATVIFDTERKAWLPYAFTLGFKKFLRYTDTQGNQHLLALKPGDNRLSEISAGIAGDYGVAFETSLLTGLYPVDQDRFAFQFTEEMEWEFSNPQGSLFVELLGIDRSKGFRSVKLAPVTTSASVTNTGWDVYSWDSKNWDDTSVVPQTFSESSNKRYTPVQSTLNAVQWHVYTNSIDARYVLRTLQTWGTPDDGGKPAQWRVKSV